MTEQWIKDWPANEIIILGVLEKESKLISKQNKTATNYNFDIKKSKEYVKNTYRDQYVNECNSADKLFTVFGTSIDSAILASFHSGETQFVKDLAYSGEIFKSFNVNDWRSCAEKICVPMLMNSREIIIERISRYLKEKKENSY